MADLHWENTYDGGVIGVDEVGRGPLAGPVVACACVVPNKTLPDALLQTITDSKQMNDTSRRRLYLLLRTHTLYAFGVCSVAEIEAMNILNATMTAMNRAIDALIPLCPEPPAHILIDGNRTPPDTALPATPIVKGDSISITIASASILAKVYRDSLMQRYARHYPVYDWHKNAGYGTKAHIEAIKTHGITPHHRLSFNPIRDMLATDSLV